MCLYPRIIKNRKYVKNKKNGGQVPSVIDQRILGVPVGCQNCIECRKQKAQQWRLRLLEDIKTNTNGKFITLTFSNESIEEIYNDHIDKTDINGYIVKVPIKELKGYERDNAIAIRAMRLFNERWRKEFKKAIRHWIVTELGHKGSENIHMHGIIWTDESYKTIARIWKYGFIWPRPEEHKKTYVNAQTINYIVKYVNKIDKKHEYYKSKILTSPGIGSNYTNTIDSIQNKYNNNKTIETYRTSTGHKINMPIYWRNKIYTDRERELLWIHKLDKQERWIMGEKIDISKGNEQYYNILEHYRKLNKQLGYGDDTKNWKQEEYEKIRRELMIEKRIQSASAASQLSKRDRD